ncbi:MAG TPA: TIR domain-containing protein [Candidatus Acidoferrales bacterium]|nr:TIR domain-containing protein [Candidatus Acidoferrales bacterium]
MLLGTMLEERGFDSQSQLIAAYQGRLEYHARKRRLFLSFHAEDRSRVDEFRQLAADPNVDVEFYDGSLQVPLNSERADYIKKILRKRISRASVAVCLIGNGTAWREWVDWELNYALRLNKGICGVRFPNSYGHTPGILKEVAAPIAAWDHGGIIAAIECAAAKRS